jgi:beta-mannosidase
MERLDLGGEWELRCLDSVVCPPESIAVNVPGSVYSALIAADNIDDPFYGENESSAQKYSDHDWAFSRVFRIPQGFLNHDSVELVCEGLDTLAEISLNGKPVASTSDMHRTYAFDAKPFLRDGDNELSITFRSPTGYMRREYARRPLVGGTGGQFPGFTALRKSHSMSGWDWGPVLPDAGIWRDIYLRSRDGAWLQDVYFTQDHSVDPNGTRRVRLDVRVRAAVPGDSCAALAGPAFARLLESFEASLSLESPAGNPLSDLTFRFEEADARALTGFDSTGMIVAEKTVSVTVESPELWWPNNLGKQPLYRLSVSLFPRGDGHSARDGDSDGVPSDGTSRDAGSCDRWSRRIGFRTLTVERKSDEWGSTFAFAVNGVRFFAMGADYVPEDSIISRVNRGKTERLVRSAVQANHNCIRVWGGANYPSDDFYDLCDEYGLVIWHDHMMACGVYELDDAFRENVVREVIDNVRRVRHHASLGLWCGNNEQEEAWCSWGWSEKFSPALKADYVRLYEELLPAVNREMDPATFYWRSSPSSGGSFDEPNAEGSGDMHNWSVWHGMQPFTAYRRCFARFMSEFGIESFPSMKTIESFTASDDRNIFSPVMESHQKCDSGNSKCLHYISATYRYPKDFSSLVYASQLIQAEGMRYGVEHWRRNRNGDRCMGAVIWQLNDCWPVASWSSIDFYGRWKALQYVARRFFAPVLVSACEDGPSVALHVTNETAAPVAGTVIWRLCDDSRTVNGAAVLETGSHAAAVPPFTDICVTTRNFAGRLPDTGALRNAYLMYEFVPEGARSPTQRGSVLFVKPKHFNFRKSVPSVTVADRGDRFAITVRSDVYARFVELDTVGFDALFSDNYFDLGAGDVTEITVLKVDIFRDSPAGGTVLEGLSADDFPRALRIRSVADAY